ncbi:hypothetical protein CONLIGDRAFT_702573 [Coniochaeta ligniaria NRRL 30616]|uniref:LysM domain-containing protein n=1 Tax=Coniochaeta ligniaria NRRL 30616 TaxID=1408157 RepID=A0A1J7ISF7_9PEZI|nr:hypothetical protein CONLIGDRAFT_702573 [Coniochaeta ligniaria NRRL 30616]
MKQRALLALWAVTIVQHPVSADVVLTVLDKGVGGLPDACVGMLNQVVNCEQSLLWATDVSRFYTDATLTALCTSTCKDSLLSYVTGVQTACGNSRYDGGDGFSYLAAYNGELILENYNLVCLTNAAGQRCNSVLGRLAGINPTNQMSTAKPASNVLCDGCALSMIKTQLEMPLASNTELSSGFSALTSSCKVMTFKVTGPSTATPWVVSATSTSTTRTGSATSSTSVSTSTGSAACVGKTYTILSTDTCTSVSLSQRISTARLFMANNLQASCSSFPKTGSLCIPSAATCEPHKVNLVGPNMDSCETLASAANTTVLQLVAWNPELGPDCANLNRLYDGYTLCLSPPGGAWVNPHPTPTANATTTSVE